MMLPGMLVKRISAQRLLLWTKLEHRQIIPKASYSSSSSRNANETKKQPHKKPPSTQLAVMQKQPIRIVTASTSPSSIAQSLSKDVKLF
jgi:hypothetical protein